MFDIGFQELLLISVLALLVMGPERLPGAIRTASLWISKFRRSFQQMKDDIQQEIGADEIRRELHNDAVLKSLEQGKQQFEQGLNEVNNNLNDLEYDISDITDKHTDSHPENTKQNHSAEDKST